MRMIDADLMATEETEAFISAQSQITDTATKLVNEVVHKKIQMLLADAPTVEIDRPTRSQFKRMAAQLGYEPVTHCRECKHWVKDTDEERKDRICENLILFHYADLYRTNENFFCAYGERRTDANEPLGT